MEARVLKDKNADAGSKSEASTATMKTFQRRTQVCAVFRNGDETNAACIVRTAKRAPSCAARRSSERFQNRRSQPTITPITHQPTAHLLYAQSNKVVTTTSAPDGASCDTTAAAAAAAATPALSERTDHGTPSTACRGTPPDTPASGASSSSSGSGGGDAWTPGSGAADDDFDAAAPTPLDAAAAAAWRAGRRAAARAAPRRRSLMPGAALRAGAAEEPGTRLLQRWRGARGVSRARREALAEYLARMAAHFAEVDAFELAEEDEGAAETPLAPSAAPSARLHAAGARSVGGGVVAAAAAVAGPTPLPLAAATPDEAVGASRPSSGRVTRSGSRQQQQQAEPTPGASSLAATTPASSAAAESPSSSGTPGSLLPFGAPRASLRPSLLPTGGAANKRRSSMAHGLLRRQTLLPASAMVRPSIGDGAAEAEPASGAAQLRARQRLSSLALLPPLPLAGAGQRASGRASDMRRSSLLPAVAVAAGAAGRRSSSLAPAAAAAAAARRSSARDSLAGGPGARPSKASLAMPGAVLEEEEAAGEEAADEVPALEAPRAAGRASAAARLSRQLAAMRVSGAGGAIAEEGADDEEEGDEAAADEETAAAAAAAGVEEFAAVIEEEEEEEDEEDEDEPADAKAARTPLQQLLAVCGQSTDTGAVLSMEELLGGLLDLKRIVKLGEGTYGEVFRAPPSQAYLDSLDAPEAADPPASIVVKLIPMEGDVEINGAPQKGAADLMAEAVIALTLSGLRAREGARGERLHSATPAFVRTCRVGVCRGRYPKLMVKAWRTWDKAHGSGARVLLLYLCCACAWLVWLSVLRACVPIRPKQNKKQTQSPTQHYTHQRQRTTPSSRCRPTSSTASSRWRRPAATSRRTASPASSRRAACCCR